MNIRQRIEYIFDEIDKISQPPTEIITISEVEEKLSRYEDGELITISHPRNTTEAWESEDLSDYIAYEGTTLDAIKEGKPTQLTKIIEDLGISKETQVTFIPRELNNNRIGRIRKLYRELRTISPLNIAFNIKPTQAHIEIQIENPIIPILGDFKNMCRRQEQRMLETIKSETHPRSQQEAIENTITGIYRNWDKPGGYRDSIATIKGVKHDNIQCDLIGEELRKKLRIPAEHKRHNLTTNDITDFVRKAQELTPEDIIINT